jgi:hypothetical protein
MRLLLAALAAFALGSAARAQPADAERAAILAQVDRFFAAMAAQDTKALEGLIYADGVMTIARVAPDGTVQTSRRPVAGWIEGVAKQPGLDERMWDPTVMRRGPLAVVWAPYEIKLSGKTIHCGIDVFDMVKVDGTWKVASLSFTAEPAACDELKRRR